jgi:hypothetical protein
MDVDFQKALAGVTALGAAFAVLATATGAFDQMQRNEPQWSAAVFGVAVLAGLLAVGGGIATGLLGKVLIAGSLIALAFAGIAGIVFLVEAQSSRPPPSIKVIYKTDPQLSLSGSVRAEEMTSKESLKVQVLGAREPSDVGRKEDILLNARLGADASGSIDLPIDVLLPSKTYLVLTVLAWVGEKPTGCFKRASKDFKQTPGCVQLRIPAA